MPDMSDIRDYGVIGALERELAAERRRYEGSSRMLSGAMGELRQVGDILGAGEEEATIDAAKRVMARLEALEKALTLVYSPTCGCDECRQIRAALAALDK